jgi:hypothetical protein
VKRISVLVLSLGLLASGCAKKGASSLGPAPSGSPTASPTPTVGTPPSPTGSHTTEPPSTTPPGGKTVSFEVWLSFGDKLFVSHRTVPFTVAVGQASLDQLLAGPDPEEVGAAIGTSIPAGLAADITALEGGVATVELSQAFYDTGVPSVSLLRRAQVVYTLTQYSTITSVRFTSGGAPVYDQAFARKDFEDELPAILVESPVIGETVSNPVTISGTANVFEATVNVRILDENGNEIARSFTMATCGTGCRGDYSVSVSYEVDHEQLGSIEVLDYSAKDGSPENVMSIPVVLTP